MNEKSFEKIKYGSFPLNDDSDDLPIEYEQRLFTKQPIDSLTDNILERLKVSLIKRSFDNRIYESNPQNTNFNYLTFDGNKRLIIRRQIYHINDDIIFGMNNGFSVDA